MSAREIVQAYFEELKQRGRWEAFLADDLTFTSLTTSPIKEVTGKAAYLESTNPANDARYRGQGFEPCGAITLPNGHVITTMWRECPPCG